MQTTNTSAPATGAAALCAVPVAVAVCSRAACARRSESAAPTISGTPRDVSAVGSPYYLSPTASGSGHGGEEAALRRREQAGLGEFSSYDRPPRAACRRQSHVGAYSNIRIT